MKRCSRAVTRDGNGAAGQNCRHQPSERWKRTVPDRVDAAVEHVQTAGGNPPVDRALAESKCGDLATLDDTVLPVGKPPDRSIGAASEKFAPHTGVKFLFVPHWLSLRLRSLRDCL